MELFLPSLNMKNQLKLHRIPESPIKRILCFQFGEFQRKYKVMKIDHVIVPVRELRKSAQSRLDVGLDWGVENGDIDLQMSVHAQALGHTIESCVVCDLPYTIMKFPDLVEDEDYCFKKLSECFKIDRKKFSEVFKNTAKPEMIKFK